MLVSLGDNGDDDEAFSFQQAALEEEAKVSGTAAWSQVGRAYYYDYEDDDDYCCSANTLTAWKRQCASDWWG